MSAAHTQGPWRAGRGCVVADHPVPEMGGSDAVEYYGGHLIAESIAPQNIPLITAAPELLESMQKYITALDAWENTNKAERRVKTAEAGMRAAIAKATGSAA